MDPEVAAQLSAFEDRLSKLELHGKSVANPAEFAALLSLAWEVIKFIREVLQPKK